MWGFTCSPMQGVFRSVYALSSGQHHVQEHVGMACVEFPLARVLLPWCVPIGLSLPTCRTC
jgi:hypothetical protein